MVIKPNYLKYSTRIFNGLIKLVLISAGWIAFVFLYDLGKYETYISLGVWGIMSLLFSISVLRKNKRYIGEIKLGKDECEFQVYEFDKPMEIIKSKTSETRIKIWELFFPITKPGRNYKLVIETKQGLTYKRIIEQHEIGNWDLEKFKEAMKNYGELKGVQSSTASFSRSIY